VTPAEILDGAIDVIHERGWTRGAVEDEVGRVCLVGAIEKATRSRADWRPEVEAQRALHQACTEHFGFKRSRRAIPAFNDQLIRDADEAIEVLKLARERLA
jgi:hypothetical protein